VREKAILTDLDYQNPEQAPIQKRSKKLKKIVCMIHLLRR
jgi:hypothetical protein